VSVARQHAEWLRLVDISGPFLSVPVLKDAFPQGLDAHEPEVSRRLRDGYEDWQSDRSLHKRWVRYVLGEVLGHSDEVLLEGQAIPPGLRHTVGEHRETLAPDLVLAEPEGGRARVLVQVHPPGTDLERPLAGSRWKESPAGRMAVLLRGTQVRLGLVTNGERWTLVDAPPNATTGYATWRAEFWLDEPLTLRAFRTLLGPRRLFTAEKETLEALLAESAERQQEVTDQLGRQVRRAVEILVHALDRTDRESKGALLAGVSERELYDAAVTFMMRLVFLFCAEEQGLFPLDDEQYAGNYAASTLFGQLNDAADEMGGQVLDRRTDAWQRLLATFRAIHGGVDHEGMALPPYGGHLFDPDRFPFLEGRPRESRWKTTAARPLPISNLTVLHLLSALQLLRDAKTGEAQRLSFRALDIEQIGHVYEGLLDHTVRKATAPMVSLKGKEAEEPEVEVSRLEELLAKGPAALAAAVVELSGRTQNAINRDLAAALPADDEHLLAVACENDAALAARVRPFAGLVRRDADGLPVVIPAGSHFVTAGSDRRSTGTHYTPRSLTEPIVRYTLEPLVYVGPAEGKPETEWTLKPAKEILALKVCDMACGSGAFLVEACRYLSKRLVEAWAEAEAANPGKVLITPEGAMSEARLSESIIPREDEERLALARRLVVDRCLYGVDINPMAVEMAKLSLWLVTLQKNVAFTFLDHCIRCGDSLLGVTDLRQIETLSMDPSKATAPLFLEEACRKAVARAREAREKLEGFTVKDVKDAERKESLLREAEQTLRLLFLLGDYVSGTALARQHSVPIRTLVTSIEPLIAESPYGRSAPPAQLIESTVASLLHESSADRRYCHRPFHWPLEFPEVFQHSGGFNGLVGNPPFLGGKRMAPAVGDRYTRYLKTYVLPEKGAADLCVYFFSRALHLVSPSGVAGLLATDTFTEGDTQRCGPASLLRAGATFTRAEPRRPWPGSAAQDIAVVHFTRGPWSGRCFIDDLPVAGIGPYLSENAAKAEPAQLAERRGRAAIGVSLLGEGFILSAAEAREMIDLDPRNRLVVRPYLIGRDISTSETQRSSRCVIDFGEMGETEAASYRAPYRRLVERVKPQRDKLTRQVHEKCFWKHWDRRTRFFASLRGQTVLVAAQVSKYWAPVFVENKYVFDQKVVVFTTERFADFAVLQSEIHVLWARREGGLNLGPTPTYTVSGCFNTFPFPWSEESHAFADTARRVAEGLERVGERYHEQRRTRCAQRGYGFTEFYNEIHDPAAQDQGLGSFRNTISELASRVGLAYGWSNLNLGHDFHETKQGIRFTISEPARREVLDRLLELNHQRYAEEVAQGLHDKGSKSAKAGKRGKGRKPGSKRASADTTDTLISLDEEE